MQAAAPSPLLCSNFLSEFGKTDSVFQRMIWWLVISQLIALQAVFRPHPADPRLRIRSRGRLRGPAVVEHDEAATKATRVLVGVNRG